MTDPITPERIAELRNLLSIRYKALGESNMMHIVNAAPALLDEIERLRHNWKLVLEGACPECVNLGGGPGTCETCARAAQEADEYAESK